MIPILYEKTETSFNNNGLGFLTDAIKCEVTEARNGEYELKLEYPSNGQHQDLLTVGSKIKAKANETSELQLFKIYNVQKSLSNTILYEAEHISYELNGLPVISFGAAYKTAQETLNKLFSESILSHNFTCYADNASTLSTEINEPCSLRACLGGQKGSILDVFGGEYEFDNFNVKLLKNRGTETDVVIAYGKNLTDINQENSIEETYTHLLPYAKIEETVITLTEKTILLIDPETIGHTKTLIVDLSNEFAEGETITETALRTKATAYANRNNLTAPKVNLKVEFLQLWQTEEYKNIASLETVKLCDTVTIKFEKLNINAKAKVIKTVYDSLKERYIKIELGDAKSNFSETVQQIKASVSNVEKKVIANKKTATTELEAAILEATNLITGQNGGYVVLNPPNNPSEILILNTPSIETATKVWRWNVAGLGYSGTGYAGPYGTAITMDGKMNADYITVGTLSADRVRAGTLTSVNINSVNIASSNIDSVSDTNKTEIKDGVLAYFRKINGSWEPTARFNIIANAYGEYGAIMLTDRWYGIGRSIPGGVAADYVYEPDGTPKHGFSGGVTIDDLEVAGSNIINRLNAIEQRLTNGGL